MNQKQDAEGLSDIFSWMGAKIKSLFVKAEPALVALIKQFFAEFEEVALAAVAAEAPKVLAGTEKFANAVAVVKDAVIAKGWSASNTLLNTIVQDSYTAWKANQKPVPGELLVKAPS